MEIRLKEGYLERGMDGEKRISSKGWKYEKGRKGWREEWRNIEGTDGGREVKGKGMNRKEMEIKIW